MSTINPANPSPFGVPPTISPASLTFPPTRNRVRTDSVPSLGSVTKKIMDVVGAAGGLFLLSPLMLAIALVIRIESRGPVLFCQPRRGRGEKKFLCLKFRTMVDDAEEKLRGLEQLNESAGGVLFKIKDDPRVTRFGRFLRRTSLDELPQLWNVLVGEMSLVGPRPLQLRDCDRLHEVDPDGYTRRLSVMPGVTGPWQVGGRSDVDGQRMVDLDLEYIDSWSLTLDIQILLRTIKVVLAGKGAC